MFISKTLSLSLQNNKEAGGTSPFWSIPIFKVILKGDLYNRIKRWLGPQDWREKDECHQNFSY